MKGKLIFIGIKKIEKPNNQKPKISFSSSTNIQFTIVEHFFKQIELSGCLTKQYLIIKVQACKSGKIPGSVQPTKVGSSPLIHFQKLF